MICTASAAGVINCMGVTFMLEKQGIEGPTVAGIDTLVYAQAK